MEIIRNMQGLKRHQHGTCILTMGALHAGHLSLIRAGVALNHHPVITTIFVNPTQFGEGEDLSQYPRPIENDIYSAEEAGSDILFLPGVEVIYPTRIDCAFTPALPSVALAPHLEDARRPAHFAGVCQVVHRFFYLLKPTYALFGEKDYQQLLVIRDMVREQRMPIEIIGCPIVREPDGLALSSRNMYLSEDERKRALGLSKALNALTEKSFNSIHEGESLMGTILQSHDIDIDYAVIRDSDTLMPIREDEMVDRDSAVALRALIAGRVGATRLIDNCIVNFNSST